VRVTVDQMKCDTTGICVKECPDVFRFQEGSKKAEVILDPVPQRLHMKCEQIANRCPTGAVVIVRQPRDPLKPKADWPPRQPFDARNDH
jgi:ferredoxin